jgi:hypothetical protein
MKISMSYCRAFGIGAAAAMLAGCGGSQPPISAPGPMQQSNASATRAAPGKSWMLPEAMDENLLYIADDGGGVKIFSYHPAQIKYVGYLAAPLYALGECVDESQDIFITSTNYSIYEYGHGSTRPKAILTDPFANPYNCASDPTTGNLAVVGYAFGSKGAGAAIFPHAHGKPKLYNDVGFGTACTYDDQGNLFMDGGDRAGFEFAELAKGTSTFENIQLNQAFEGPGGVQWDGKYVAVGDYFKHVIYEFSISRSTGTEVGSTPLTGAGTVWQFFVDSARGKVIVPSAFEDYAGFANVYRYPSGGKALHRMGSGTPDGAVVSLAPR